MTRSPLDPPRPRLRSRRPSLDPVSLIEIAVALATGLVLLLLP